MSWWIKVDILVLLKFNRQTVARPIFSFWRRQQHNSETNWRTFAPSLCKCFIKYFQKCFGRGYRYGTHETFLLVTINRGRSVSAKRFCVYFACNLLLCVVSETQADWSTKCFRQTAPARGHESVSYSSLNAWKRRLAVPVISADLSPADYAEWRASVVECEFARVAMSHGPRPPQQQLAIPSVVVADGTSAMWQCRL